MVESVDFLTYDYPEEQEKIKQTLENLRKTVEGRDIDKLETFHFYGPKFTRIDDGQRIDSAQCKEIERQILVSADKIKCKFSDVKIDVFDKTAIVLECKACFALQDILYGQTGVNRNPIDPQKVAVNRHKSCDVISLFASLSGYFVNRCCDDVVSIRWAEVKIANQIKCYLGQTCIRDSDNFAIILNVCANAHNFVPRVGQHSGILSAERFGC